MSVTVTWEYYQYGDSHRHVSKRTQMSFGGDEYAMAFINSLATNPNVTTISYQKSQ